MGFAKSSVFEVQPRGHVEHAERTDALESGGRGTDHDATNPSRQVMRGAIGRPEAVGCGCTGSSSLLICCNHISAD